MSLKIRPWFKLLNRSDVLVLVFFISILKMVIINTRLPLDNFVTTVTKFNKWLFLNIHY